jgi:hypothetical protein
MDLMRIGGMILGLFKRKKRRSQKTVPEIDFSTVAKKNQKFYLETKLKLMK